MLVALGLLSACGSGSNKTADVAKSADETLCESTGGTYVAYCGGPCQDCTDPTAVCPQYCDEGPPTVCKCPGTELFSASKGCVTPDNC